MNEHERSLQELHQIKTMMERSSRFISLSGLSGISAGLCALGGAFFSTVTMNDLHDPIKIQSNLILIAILTFITAFVSAFLFTWLRSQSQDIPMWGPATVRLFWNTAIPLMVGGIFLLKVLQLKQYVLIAPGCLIFYGLSLVNASKYTLGEIRYLGYGQLILGLLNLWITGYGLIFWALGFGVLHIVYGILMWWKYERNENKQIYE